MHTPNYPPETLLALTSLASILIAWGVSLARFHLETKKR
jgi:hypothetical protein